VLVHGVEVGEGEVECSAAASSTMNGQQAHGVLPRCAMCVVLGLWGLWVSIRITREIHVDGSRVQRDGHNPFFTVSPSEFIRE
jgi:hypothetical protein